MCGCKDHNTTNIIQRIIGYMKITIWYYRVLETQKKKPCR